MAPTQLQVKTTDQMIYINIILMTIPSANKKEKRPRKTVIDKVSSEQPDDSMPEPVREHTEEHKSTEKEKALYRQAENPLGNPDRE